MAKQKIYGKTTAKAAGLTRNSELDARRRLHHLHVLPSKCCFLHVLGYFSVILSNDLFDPQIRRIFVSVRKCISALWVLLKVMQNSIVWHSLT